MTEETEDYVVPMISKEARDLFQFVTRSNDPSLGLMAGLCNGEPTTIIVRVEEIPSIIVGGKSSFSVYPLYVRVTPGMNLVNPMGKEAEDISDATQDS